MVNAIGPAALYNSIGTGNSTAGLEAQIARYQKELSSCTICESARTPEGKAAISELAGKISAARARIEQIENAKALERHEVQKPVAEPGDVPGLAPGLRKSAAAPDKVQGAIGGRLDIFA
jgi:hypothetical protein